MIRATLLLAALAGPASAATLEVLPGASLSAETVEPLGGYAVPVSPWADGKIETLSAEGRVSFEAWQVPSSATTLQLLSPLREQLVESGFEIIFECETDRCGGFDFRYSTEVLPEPEMHVDLGDFRFLSARKTGGETPEYVTFLVSRSTGSGYVQMVKVGPATDAEEEAELASKSPADPLVPVAAVPAASGLGGKLESSGRAVLANLSFETGSARLAGADFPSLAELAEYLRANPGRRVTLVGHTDAAGSLDANITLSRARARAVLDRLVDAHGIPMSQLEADGVGYLLPLASNLTEEGRASNRRVEVVLSSVE